MCASCTVGDANAQPPGAVVAAGKAAARPADAGAGGGRAARATGAGGAAGAGSRVTTVPTKAALLDRLRRLNQSEQFLFGQENATLWGMYLDGALTSTGKWFESTASAGRFTSDSEALVGDRPAVLGVSLGMLAFEPKDWNRRAPIARAVRLQIAGGGVVTMDWHAPSCTAGAAVRPNSDLGTVQANGRDVVIQSVPGGTSFYAEDEYKQPIKSLADVPETLKCLCQIANDLPLSAGAYRGTPGRTWLVAQAKYIAQVFRSEGLAGLPIVFRPFHEHTGSWFWWGQPYWNCAALLDKADAVSGPAAYIAMAGTLVSTLRAEPGMGNLLFAYSPDRLLASKEQERWTVAQKKVMEPSAVARDQLRARLLRELEAAGLAFASSAQRALKLTAAKAKSPRLADAYVAERRAHYSEAYAGDDVFDVLGTDLYHPLVRPAGEADLQLFRLQLRVLAEEARARSKPYAWTEAGTYRLQLGQLVSEAPRGKPLAIHAKASVDDALALLFDPADRAALLRHFGLSQSGAVALSARERAAVAPQAAEDWFNRQLLVLAKESKVAYALVWQTYYDSSSTGRYFHYYVPYPGHPDAPSFERFYADPATCFLRDSCGE